MHLYRLPVARGATLATTPDTWEREFAASTTTTPLRRLRLRLSHAGRLAKRYIPPRSKVLDAGCGFGDWVVYLQTAGYDASGCDFAPITVRRLREAYPDLAWTEADIRALPYEGGSFDAIISWGVIEHDPNGPGAALQEFRRVLRPGGVAIVTVPVDSPMARKAEDEFCRVSGQEHAFFQFLMSEEELRREATSAGFEIIESGSLPQAHINHVAPWLARRMPPLIHRLANLAAVFFLSWNARFRVMIFAVLRKPRCEPSTH